MAYVHIDTDDGGSNTSPYETWVKAATLTNAITVINALSDGDTCFVQGSLPITQASTLTLTPGSSASNLNPVKIIGVVDNLSAREGAAILASDLAVTLPVISVTGGSSDITFGNDSTNCLQ